jgi:hypothetical protein
VGSTPSGTWEAEAGRVKIRGQLGYIARLSQKKKKKEKEKENLHV